MLYHITRTRGTGYDLTERNLSGDVTAMLRHYGFQLTAQYRHGATTLVGESKVTAEKFSLVDLSYSRKQWMFSAGVVCPFTKYDQPQSLQGGRKVWMLARMPHRYIIAGDEIAPYLVVNHI